jgi:hypothetical protein
VQSGNAENIPLDSQTVHPELKYVPENWRRGCKILQDRKLFLKLAAPVEPEISKKYADITEARPLIEAVVKDGMELLVKYYDFSSEENMLRALPPKYKVFNGSPSRVMEESEGVMMCIVHILLGDFDFVKQYRSDDYKTNLPKRIADLDKIIAALPELKRRYAETGRVI